MTDLPFDCRCGAVHGRLRDVRPAVGTHLVCYCRDCRAYARHLGDPGVLDEAGGTELFQTSAARIAFDRGTGNLACLRMTPRGPLRWYAACCNSAIANSAPVAAVPFAGVVVARLAAGREALGPVIAHACAASATPRAGTSPRSFGLPQVLFRFARITIAARGNGDHRRNPFWHDGRPLRELRLLTAEEQRNAYD